jgi:serine/threonine-protein kinase
MALPGVGEVFAGKYAIEAVVGRGGMGVVLAARHLELDERVAIKLILADEGPKGAEFVARFVREAKLASKIKSEHVVRVLDVARLQTGEPYIVMELLEGQDLAQLLTRNGPLPIELAAYYVLQACEAIAEAHSLGIVHRDLKPANLFLATLRDGRPCVKVLDFGISKLMGEQGGHAMTQTNALMGSPLYMSPDQLVQARDLDARSDVWALGVILFELLTGRAPFDGDDAPQLIAQILHRPAPSVSSFRPDVPRELAALIDSALVKDREQRIPNVAELARGLVPFAPEAGRFSLERIAGMLSRSGVVNASGARSAQVSWSASSSSSRAGTPSATAGGAALDLGSTRKPSSAVPIVAGLVALLALGGIAALFLAGRTSTLTAPPRLPPAAGSPVPLAPPTSVAVVPAPAPSVSAAPSSAAVAASAATPKVKPAAPAPRPAVVTVKPSSKPAAPVPADPFGGVR